MVKVFVCSLCVKPYQDVDIGAFEAQLTNAELSDFFAAKDDKGKAKVVLGALKTERDREDALAYWLNAGKLTADDVRELKAGVEEQAVFDAAAEDAAMAELLDAGYDVEEAPAPVEEKPKKARKRRAKKDDEEAL